MTVVIKRILRVVPRLHSPPIPTSPSLQRGFKVHAFITLRPQLPFPSLLPPYTQHYSRMSLDKIALCLAMTSVVGGGIAPPALRDELHYCIRGQGIQPGSTVVHKLNQCNTELHGVFVDRRLFFGSFFLRKKKEQEDE